jgi:hypothetical protein
VGEQATAQFGDLRYDVSLVQVGQQNGVNYARFSVNGEQSLRLEEGESYQHMGGVVLTVNEILFQDYAGGIHSADYTIYPGAIGNLLVGEGVNVEIPR